MSYERAFEAFRADVEPDAEAEARVAAAIAARRGGPRQRSPRPSPGGALAVGIAATAALGLVAWVAGPPPDLDLALSAGSPPAITPEVRLLADGSGHVAGSRTAPRIAWEHGTLHADVSPGQGIDLRVHTPEATIAVVGTAFEVQTDAAGTRVRVEHGIVDVACQQGASARLGDDETLECWPVTAARLLGRATWQAGVEAPLEDQLQTLEAGLRASPQAPATEAALRHRHIQVLGHLGRFDAALEACHDFLGRDLPLHADEVAAYAAVLEAAVAPR